LICRAVAGDTIAVCPPLIIDGAGCNQMFDALGKALDRGLAWAKKEGLLA
ncbi:MAG TPA: aspartate aminotransferase family protein, partial [Hyphomicrobiaceae bacterium]|nr:aspartate aminotransferase family protein [Hyphomicrobiaceae bacterium]